MRYRTVLAVAAVLLLVLLVAAGQAADRWHGYVALVTDSALIVRGDDGHTYIVDARAVPAADWQRLALGQPVTIQGRAGANAQQLIASAVRVDRTNGEGGPAPAPFRAVHGTVQAHDGPLMLFRTDTGSEIQVDMSGLTWQTAMWPSEHALLVYEERGPATKVGVWIEPDRVG